MRNKRVTLLFGLIIILSGWWFLRSGSPAQPEEGILDVWATWGEDPEHLQAFLNSYSQLSGIPLKVTTQVRSDDLLGSLSAIEPPDMVILSSVDPIQVYYEKGLVEPLDAWIETTGIDLDDFYIAPLQRCKSVDGATLCLPWGCDIDALFWNKDLFEDAGLDPERPPQTLEELVEYAKKLTLRNEEGELGQVGFIPNLTHSQAGLSAMAQAEVGALIWQQQFDHLYTPDELDDFVASFTPYITSSHPVYAGKRLSCQQCHRAAPIQNNKTPDVGFYEGRVAMMIDGQWQVSLNARPEELPMIDYGVAPIPPSSAHPDMANTAVVQGPVVFIPAGAMDEDAAAQLLSWLTSPEILAEAAYTHAMLPVSKTAAQDARFQKNPDLKLFIDLMARPNTKDIITTQ